MSLEDNQFLLFDPGDGGASMEVPVRRESAFREKFPNARRLQLFDVGDGGEAMEVPEDRLDAFRAKYPKAERLYLFDEKDGGAAMEVPRAKLGAYIQKKAAPDKGGLTLRSGIRDAATAAVRVPAAAVAGAVQGVAGTLADLGPGDAARRERQRALDAAPERIPTMKEAGREIGLSQKEIDALPDRPVTLRDLDDPRFGQAYRDRVRATMNRVAANAPETEAEKAHREEAERLQAKADKLSAPLMEPRNAAERAAMHFGGGVATVGELGLAGALGGPAAVPLWMGATGAAREAARQEAEGKTPREAMAGALAPAAAEAAAWTVPVPVGQGATALGRVGREALTMGVKSDLAGTARRTLSGEEAPALSDRIAEDLGAAAMGGALGAAREGAGAAGRAVVRAIEGDARNRAAKVAALDPAGTLGRAAEAATPPEYREAARNLEAAAVPESPMDAYARRKAAEANPASDFAGEAGREFLARGARELGDREAAARRTAEEELAPAEVPQVPVDEVPPTVAPEDRGGVQTPPPAPEPAPTAPVAGSATPPRAKRVRKPKAAAPVAGSDTPPPAETMTGPVASSDPATQAAALRGMADRSDALVARFDEWAKTPEGRKAVREEADAKDAFQKAIEAVNRAQRNLDKIQSDSVKYPSDGKESKAAQDELNRAWTDYSIAQSNWNAAAARVGRPLDAGADLRGRADRIGEEPLPGRPEGSGAGRAVVEKDGEVPVVRGDGLPSGTTVREQMPQQREWLKDAVKVAANQAFEGRRTGAKSTKGANVSALYDTNIPDGIPPKVRIEIPGDGKFTLVNEKHVIEEWGKRMDQALAPSGLARSSIPTGAASSRGEAKPAKNAPGSFARPDATKLLAPFAGKEHPQAILNEPFGDGEFAYATDGRYFARLRSRGEPFKKKGAKSEVDGLANGLNTYLNAERNLLGDFEVAPALRNVREMIASGGGNPVVVGVGKDGELAFATLATEYGDAAGAARAGEFSPTGEQIGVFNPEYFATILELAAKTGNARIELGRPVKGDPILLVRGSRGNMDAGLMPFQNVEGGPEGMAKRVGSELGELSDRPAAPFRTRAAGARADVAAETPRAAGAPAPESPHEGLRTKLRVLVDSGATPDELEAFAREAEASDAFATAALARQRAGTYRGTPWGTEGGNWPHEEPPAARASFGDLFTLAQRLGDGKAPSVLRRISRRPWAAGVFRFVEGDPKSGSVEQLSREFELTTPEQRAEILAKARKQAEAEGGTPSAIEARAQELYDRLYERAWRDAAFAGPKQAMAVLAHEIGHWIDFLDEGTLKRGNVLGHLAALKKYLGGTLFPTKAAADAAGMPGVSQEAVKAAAKEWGVTQKEARERLTAGADLKNLPEIRREMESLVAWFRQSDGAPDYFRKDPAELYAEAFSAWVNYPAEAARRAPEFSELLDGWLEARPEAARALEEFRSGVTQAEARAAKAAGDTTNPAFFAARSEEAEAARWWQRRKAAAAAKLRERPSSAFWNGARVALSGPMDVIRHELWREGSGKAFDTPEKRALWRAMRQAENTGNLAALWDYRFKAFVEPELQGVPYATFLEFMKHRRIASERLGPEGTRGRMNLPNPGGVTPGDLTRAEGNAQTSSAAWLHELERTQPELYGKLSRAADAFWDKVRNGNDDLGGDGSPLAVVRDSPCLSAEQKRDILRNREWVSFSNADVADPSRPMKSEEQSYWDGIRSQRTGSFKEPGDVIANSFRQDATLMGRLNQMEYALRTIDWLRANRPKMVGEKAGMVFDNATKRWEVDQGTRPGWRTVTFLRDGKPEGWWVPVEVADAIEIPGRGERSWDGLMRALSGVKRFANAAQTSFNLPFNTNNSWLKDPHSLALRLPNLPVRGQGALKGTARVLGNLFGHYGEMLGSYMDKSGADYAKGRWNPDTARALAWGAVNNAAPGSTAYAHAEGGGLSVLENRLRDRGLEDQTLSDERRRELLKARGLTEEQIDAGLRSADGALARWAKAWDSLGKVPRIARKLYPAVLSQLQHGEIRTKSYALKRILAERPDIPREEAVEIARQMIGTPDMANKPVVDRNPALGALLMQYFTPRVHSWTEQLRGGLRRGWTGGTKEQLGRFSRLATVVALASVPFLASRDAYERAQRLGEEEDEARRRGDLALAERLRERKERAARWARLWDAIPTRDKFSGFVLPIPGTGRHLKFSFDPTIVPLTTTILGAMFGRDYGITPGKAVREGIGAEVSPGLSPAYTAVRAATTGTDPNTGRPVGGSEDADLADQLAWILETATGRSWGTGAITGLREMFREDGPRDEDRKSRADIPILSAIWKPFLRKSGYGEVEKANAMRKEQERSNRRKSDIAERIVTGKTVSDEEKEWFVRHAANPGESLRAAAERVWKMRNWTPDQRAADSLGKLDRREIEERFHYVEPPRLTDEDRNR